MDPQRASVANLISKFGNNEKKITDNVPKEERVSHHTLDLDPSFPYFYIKLKINLIFSP
jgi:hypothetical protein